MNVSHSSTSIYVRCSFGNLNWSHRYEVIAVRTNTKDSDTLAQVQVPYTVHFPSFSNYANASPRAVRKGLVESFLQQGKLIVLEPATTPGPNRMNWHDEHR